MRAEAAAIGAVGAFALAAAVAMITWWGGRDVADPPTERSIGSQVRWWLRLVVVTILTGIVAGVLVPGIGGRLAMRVLAATAGDDAQGMLTEADENVGIITLGGTIGFIVFVGLLGGLIGAMACLVLRPVLPRGRLGGLLLGVVGLVVFASRVDPLRSDNPEFQLVGPDIVSVLVFSSLTVLFGMTVAALFNRLSAAVPLLDTRRKRTLVPYVALVMLVLVPPVLVAVVVAGAVVIAVRSTPALQRVVEPARAITAARVALGVVVLAAAPGFVTGVGDILSG